MRRLAMILDRRSNVSEPAVPSSVGDPAGRDRGVRVGRRAMPLSYGSITNPPFPRSVDGAVGQSNKTAATRTTCRRPDDGVGRVPTRVRSIVPSRPEMGRASVRAVRTTAPTATGDHNAAVRSERDATATAVQRARRVETTPSPRTDRRPILQQAHTRYLLSPGPGHVPVWPTGRCDRRRRRHTRWRDHPHVEVGRPARTRGPPTHRAGSGRSQPDTRGR
jgi:hypothetical protein